MIDKTGQQVSWVIGEDGQLQSASGIVRGLHGAHQGRHNIKTETGQICGPGESSS